jgi:hypothetical protein
MTSIDAAQPTAGRVGDVLGAAVVLLVVLWDGDAGKWFHKQLTKMATQNH